MAGTPDATVAAATGTPDLDVELDGGGGSGGSGGVTDHGALTGLADDDHPAYPTTAEAQTLVDTHVNDTTAAHNGTAVAFTPAGGIAATTVAGALAELDSEKETPAGAQSKADAAQTAAEAASATDLAAEETARLDAAATHAAAADPHGGYALESWAAAVVVTANQIKTNDAVIAVHTPTSGPALAVAIGTAGTWLFDMDAVTRGTVTGDIAIQIQGPAGATGAWSAVGLATGATGVEGDVKTVTADIGATTRTFGTVGTTAALETVVRIHGRVVAGGTAGNVALWFAQATAAPATEAHVRTNSTASARRIA